MHKNVNIDRKNFLQMLKENDGILIFKFGAGWCKPCHVAEPFINARIECFDDSVNYYELDVDQSFDLYAYLQSKKMVNGIPAILAYSKENTSFVSDCCVMGANQKEINAFFDKVAML